MRLWFGTLSTPSSILKECDYHKQLNVISDSKNSACNNKICICLVCSSPDLRNSFPPEIQRALEVLLAFLKTIKMFQIFCNVGLWAKDESSKWELIWWCHGAVVGRVIYIFCVKWELIVFVIWIGLWMNRQIRLLNLCSVPCCCSVFKSSEWIYI